MSGHNINFASRLASELGGIPLALDQAGAYMQISECGIADYLELYSKHKHELMSDPEFKGASDYDRTTYGTWDISMQKIEDMAANDGNAAQSAIKILSIFAFLDHANCYNTVRTPTLCKPDTSDRPYLFSLSTYLI
jgi:hypothetical protein